MLPTSAAPASGRTSLNKDSRKVGHRERTHPREYVMSFSFRPRSSNILSIGNPCRSSSTSRISTFRPMQRLIEMHHESCGLPKPANRNAGNTNTEWWARTQHIPLILLPRSQRLLPCGSDQADAESSSKMLLRIAHEVWSAGHARRLAPAPISPDEHSPM